MNLLVYYRRGKLVSYFLNNAAKTCSYELKSSENIEIGHFFQSRNFFHLSSNLHTSCISAFNDTHRERLMFLSSQYRNGWLAASDLSDMFTQSIKFYTFHYRYRCLKNVIHQIDSKNGWLLFQQVLQQNLGQFLSEHWKTLFLRGFILNSTERAQVLLKKGFSKQSSAGEIGMFLCDDQWKF